MQLRDLALLPFLAGVAQAQIVPIGPFTGSHSEGFELQTQSIQSQCITDRVFTDTADLCVSGNTGANITGAWGFGCSLQEHSGTRLFGSASGSATFTFDEPVAEFGGFFTTNHPNPGSLTVDFFSGGGALIASLQEPLDNDCTWDWLGWEAQSTLIGSITFTYSEGSGGFVMMDSLELTSTSGIGTNFCMSAINSSGGEALIFAGGSASLAANNLVLNAQPVPALEPGIFYYGPNEILQPFGDGFRCVALGGVGTIFRLFPFAQSDMTELMSYPVDYTAAPPGGQIVSGSTWKFQAWFRDPAANGAGFNLSDGLSITFGP
jgi:hypothetical protein